MKLAAQTEGERARFALAAQKLEPETALRRAEIGAQGAQGLT